MESLFVDIYHALLKNKKIPKIVSWLYISIFILALVLLFFFAGFSILRASGLIFAIFSWLLSLITIYFWIVMTLRIIRFKR